MRVNSGGKSCDFRKLIVGKSVIFGHKKKPPIVKR